MRHFAVFATKQNSISAGLLLFYVWQQIGNDTQQGQESRELEYILNACQVG